MQTVTNPAVPMSALPIPSAATLTRLFIGGAAGLFVWEIWARVFTNAVLGYPLEPAGLIDALLQHNLGLSVPWLAREAMHYAIGIVGYPLVYFAFTRLVPRAGTVMDAIVFVTFTAGVLFATFNGTSNSFHLIFWLIVTAFIATRLVNPYARLRQAISWGTFTWLSALGIFAPLGGLSFYLLGEGGALSFMSFAGHVIYGAIAAYLFETLEARG